MLAACFLPWVLLRPNRLAAGEFLRLAPAQVVLGIVLALALPALARWRPAWLPPLANAVFGLGLYWLGRGTADAAASAGDLARASASSGVWLWLVGAAVGLYGAGRVSALLGQPAALRLLWRWLWLPVAAFFLLGGQLSAWSVIHELSVQHNRFWQELGQHLKLVLGALALAVLIGAPLAVWASQRPRLAGVVLSLANGVQTIPSLALLGLLIAPLAALSSHFPALKSLGISGIGTAPALTAMTLYALLPIVQNGVVALRGVNAGVLDAARGMGMTDTQRFWRVQLPLALPVWLSGLRQAAVLLVGVASVAQLIGAGGLGYFIFSGLQSGAGDLILLGAIPAALLAVGLDQVLRGLENWLGRTGESRA